MLGPGWKSTTHILQARDLMRTRGAMAKFEEFLRPTGAGSTDTLAGRMSWTHTIVESFQPLKEI